MTVGRVVICAIRPKPGGEARLAELVSQHVDILRKEGLATDREPIIMRAEDGTMIEVFEWASAEAIQSAHENPVVTAMWNDYAEVCEFIPAGQVTEIGQMFSEFSPAN